MGCVGSTTARTSSPVHYQQHAEVQRGQTPARSPNLNHPGMQPVNRNLRSVLNETSALVDQIGMSRQSIGESLRPVHEEAIKLRNRIQSKLARNPMRGSGPDDYRQLLNNIRQDFNAISTAGDYDSRYFEQSMIFEPGSSMPYAR